MLQLPGKQLESLRSRSAASVTIDNGIAEKAVEPRHDRFGVWGNIGPSQYLGEGVLQNILRGVPVTDATFKEPQKRPVILQQNRYLASHRGVSRHRLQNTCVCAAT